MTSGGDEADRHRDARGAPAAGARYTAVAIVLHWLIAALMVFQVALGLRMEAAHGSAKFVVFQLHKSIGITILLLVAVRLLWRLFRRPPAIVAHGWERALAHAVHALFYLLLFALPISGWVIVSTSRIAVPTLLYGAIPWPHVPGLAGLGAVARDAWHAAGEFTHVNLVLVLYALFALHVAGALKHHLIDRDGGIARMAPGTRPGAWADPRLILIAAGAMLAAALGRAWPPGAPTSAPPPPPPVEALPAPPPPAATPDPDEVAALADAAPPAATAADPPAAEAKGEPSSWTIAPGSTLGFRTSWSGAPIEGGFARFEGDIRFGPDALDRSSVEIRVDTGSAFSGDGQRDETLKSDDWFSIGRFATATFTARRFRKVGADRYVADGTLGLKGVTLPVSVPFSLKIDGAKVTMRGSATIDRTAFRIGEGEYAATDEIPAQVKVAILLHATRKP